MSKTDGYLYLKENFTSFSLCADGEEIDEDYLDITLDNNIQLLCAKCKRPLTKDEYTQGKLQVVNGERKIDGVKQDELSPIFMAQYTLEHKRCSHK